MLIVLGRRWLGELQKKPQVCSALDIIENMNIV